MVPETIIGILDVSATFACSPFSKGDCFFLRTTKVASISDVLAHLYPNASKIEPRLSAYAALTDTVIDFFLLQWERRAKIY